MNCKNCGCQNSDDLSYCMNCGKPLHENEVSTNNTNEDKGSIGYAFLGFFLPLIGVILYLIWKRQRRGDAKKALIGALIGIGISIACVILSGMLWGGVQDSLMQNTCKLYGNEYQAESYGGKWYCINPYTGERIEISSNN